MKHIALSVFFLIISIAKISAQNDTTSGTWSLIIESGPNVSKTNTDGALKPNMHAKIGHAIGLGIVYQIDSRFALKTGIGTQRKGGDVKIPVVNDDGDKVGTGLRYVQDYLTIPLLLRYSLLRNGRLYINAGPYLSALTRSTIQVIGGKDHFDDTKNYTDKVYGFCSGIGGKLALNPVLTLGAEYQYCMDLGGKNYITNRSWSQRSSNLIFSFQYTFHK